MYSTHRTHPVSWCVCIINDKNSMKGNYRIEQCYNSDIIIESSSVMSYSINLRIIYCMKKEQQQTTTTTMETTLTWDMHDFFKQFFFAFLNFLLRLIHTRTKHHATLLFCCIISGEMKCKHTMENNGLKMFFFHFTWKCIHNDIREK